MFLDTGGSTELRLVDYAWTVASEESPYQRVKAAKETFLKKSPAWLQRPLLLSGGLTRWISSSGFVTLGGPRGTLN